MSATRRRVLTDAEILEGIGDVARRHLGWSGPIRGDQRIVETLRLDSLRLLTLVVEVENRFRICLDQGGETDIVTVEDLVGEIRRKLESSAHAE